MALNAPERARYTDPVAELGDGRETPEMGPYREVLACRAEGRPIALVTIIGAEGSAPRGMGAVMAVRADGSIVGTVGGGNLELFAVRYALEALQDGRSRRLHYDFSGGPEQNVEKVCGGTTDFFVQPFVAMPRLIIFGAGHVGMALAPIAHACGFAVTVVDDRAEFLARTRFPAEIAVRGGSFVEAVTALHIDAATYIVITTYGHIQDEAVLAACLPLPWRYLGLMGSRVKIVETKRKLGVTPEAREQLARIHAPVGLDLGGRSPGEISVSIMAEILAVRYERQRIGFLTSVAIESSRGGEESRRHAE